MNPGIEHAGSVAPALAVTVTVPHSLNGGSRPLASVSEDCKLFKSSRANLAANTLELMVALSEWGHDIHAESVIKEVALIENPATPEAVGRWVADYHQHLESKVLKRLATASQTSASGADTPKLHGTPSLASVDDANANGKGAAHRDDGGESGSWLRRQRTQRLL